MNKVFWIGLFVFLIGMSAVGASAYKMHMNNAMDHNTQTDLSFKNIIPSFLLPTHTISPTPKASTASVKNPVKMTLYYDLNCSYCHEFSNTSLLPFLAKYSQKFEFALIPFSKNTVEKDQNESLLLYCLLQTEKPMLVLEKTKDMSNDWKAWRDAQPNAEVLKTCMNLPETYPNIQALREQAKLVGVKGTPTLIVDNEKWEGMLSPESLITILAEYLQ